MRCFGILNVWEDERCKGVRIENGRCLMRGPKHVTGESLSTVLYVFSHVSIRVF